MPATTVAIAGPGDRATGRAGRCGKQSHGIIGNMLPTHWGIRLTKEDRDDRGRIEHHQLGTPFSS
jgi:hypothetical protein